MEKDLMETLAAVAGIIIACLLVPGPLIIARLVLNSHNNLGR